MKKKVNGIGSVFQITCDKWFEYIKKRSNSQKYIKCRFDDYIWWNRDEADWMNAPYFEDYFDNKDYWIKKYSNPKYFDKEAKEQFKNYFDEMYSSYKENGYV